MSRQFITRSLKLRYIVLFFVEIFFSSIISASSPQSLSERIAYLIESYCLTYDIDQYGENPPSEKPLISGRVDLIKKIEHFVQQKKPLSFSCIGFPFKSINTTKKVTGILLDMAERFSLEFINGLLEKIKEIYKPGANLTLYTDGSAFADVFQVSQQTVKTYETSLKQLVKDLPNIKIITLSDLACNQDPIILLEKEPNTAPSTQELDILKQRLRLEFDSADGQKQLGSEPESALFRIAANLTKRSQQFGAYIKKIIPPENLRCSVHFQENIGKKIGLKLSPNSPITPWHGVLVKNKNGQTFIRYLHQIDQNYYRIEEKVINGISCTYYAQK